MAGRLLGSALGCAVPVSFAFAHQTLGTYATALEGLVGADFVPTSAAAAPGDNLKSDKAMAAELPELQGTVLSRPVFTLLQLLGMLIVLIAGLGPVGGCLALSLWLILGPIGFPALAIIPFVWAAGTATHLILALIAKHLFFGSRLRPGAYRLYSLTFLRWWLQRKLLSITRTWLWYLNQTPFINYAYRLLGASIAPVVCLDDAVIEDPDLVTISEGSYLQPFSTLVPGEILGNALVLRTVAVGAHVKLEPRSAVLGGGAVGDGCVLRPWAAVTATSPAACGAVMEGSPALPSGKIGLDGGALWRPKYATSAWFALGQAIGCYLLIGINVAAFGSSMAIARVSNENQDRFSQSHYFHVPLPSLKFHTFKLHCLTLLMFSARLFRQLPTMLEALLPGSTASSHSSCHSSSASFCSQ